MKNSSIALVSLGLLALLVDPKPVAAGQQTRQKVAEWGDPLTPPQSRTDCVNYASGNWPWGGGWKSCIGWRTQWRHMEIEAYLAVSGPDDLSADVQKVVRECALTAAAAAGSAAALTSGAALPAALGAAKVAFTACMATKGSEIGSEYSVNIDSPTHWTDWS